MRKYEAVFIFRSEEEKFNAGKETAKSELLNLGATIVEEKDMGARSLTYTIKKQDSGHYYLFVIEVEPEKVQQIEEKFKLKNEILKMLVVKIDE